MKLSISLALAASACTTSTADDNHFTVESSDVSLAAGQEVTYCYYFHTPNTEPLAISKWTSELGPGSHHMILFFNSDDQPADGTLADNCTAAGPGATSLGATWVFAAQQAQFELETPADDGTGKPIAMTVPAHQAAFLQIHYINASDAPLTTHVTLDAYALAAGTEFTETAPLITYNSTIQIAPHETGHLESRSCGTPAGVQFWMMSTHAHKQAVATDLKDGATVLFSSTDWEHPGMRQQASAPFLTFASNKMTYECTYDNTGDNANSEIVSGPSAQTNEMCMGLGYFFPATGPKYCFDDQGPF
jgi:hypothetical protein